VYTAGQCWGANDAKVFAAFSRTVERLKSDGREVVIMTAHPNDDRWAIEIMRRAGHDDLPYVPGYENLDASLALIASSELVIGERLHAVVLAGAVGTPFVAVEYRPKLKDFALSVGREDTLVRTDKIGELDSVVDLVLSKGASQSDETTAAVEAFRQKQATVAEQLRSKLQP
jgi:polysaccharide pyruvyl transferase WcaK-like protein